MLRVRIYRFPILDIAQTLCRVRRMKEAKCKITNKLRDEYTNHLITCKKNYDGNQFVL